MGFWDLVCHFLIVAVAARSSKYLTWDTPAGLLFVFTLLFLAYTTWSILNFPQIQKLQSVRDWP